MSDAKQPPERRQVVLDTSVLLNFLCVGRLDLLVGLPGHEFLLTDHVRGEVTEPTHAETLRAALQDGRLREVRVDDPGELETFGRLRALRMRGVGECEALAVAVRRGLPIAIDEKVAQKADLVMRSGLAMVMHAPGTASPSPRSRARRDSRWRHGYAVA